MRHKSARGQTPPGCILTLEFEREVPGLMKRRLIVVSMLACMAVQPGLAVRRRGAKLYPDKETTADMSGKGKIFVGWVDMNEDDFASHGYPSKEVWGGKIVEINAELLRLCQVKLEGKTVVGAKSKGDVNASNYDLAIKFTDVKIDYSHYHVYLALHFIDPATNQEIGSLPDRPYFGNDWGLVNYIKNAMDEAAQKIKVEITGGGDAKKKHKIPLIHKKDKLEPTQ